ncbi:MAG TPA: histidine phosphatase family protein, partial [Polyangia bacterium]|nr:histidine phosphatase family protein [Polyangia bacterium]
MGRSVEDLGDGALKRGPGRGGRDGEGRDVLSLYLLRHGETAFSHHNRFCGRIDAPLTAEGRVMAAAFAEAYAPVAWDAIVTSSRTRTVDTAMPLAARLGLQIRRDGRLDEMSYGDWQGLSKAEAAGRHPEHFARWLEDPSIGAPNGELPRSVAERAMADRTWTFGHVIVDEAQELSPMAWRLLMRRCPARSMTLVGDVAQTGDPAGAASWGGVLAPHVGDRWRLAELTVNYRTPA